jgi:hypothetical protein
MRPLASALCSAPGSGVGLCCVACAPRGLQGRSSMQQRTCDVVWPAVLLTHHQWYE